MTISKENRQDDDEWKEIISRRIRRVEITIFMLVASFIVSLPEKILSYHQNPTPTKTTRKIEDEVTFASLRGHPDVMTFNTHNETSDRNKIKKTSGKQFSRKLDPVIISYQKSRTRSNQTALISPGHFYEQNNRELQPTKPSIPCKTLFRLNLQLDDVPEDTSWQLDNRNTRNIEMRQYYTSNDVGLEKVYTYCLRQGVYTFSIFDSLGDGINCRDDSGCFNISINNELFIKGDMFSRELSHGIYVSNDGVARERICHNLPILSPINQINNYIYDERMGRVMDIIYGLSSFDVFSNKFSNQYKAACWLLYDDIAKLLPVNDLLIERYALAVSLFATSQETNFFYTNNTCDFDKNKVTCNDEGHITRIKWHGIKGTIPPELSYLRHLESLDLSNSQLEGPIPEELGELINLKVLRLNYNDLTGTIPRQIGGLYGLEELYLHGNNFQGTIPAELGLCAQLVKLELNMNDLEGPIPSQIFGSFRLKCLKLNNNRLTGTIPSSISELQHLETLYLFNNNLTGQIPPEIGSMASLSDFILANNRLTGSIPIEFGHLNSLKFLSLNNNSLAGTIPEIFTNLTKMQLISLARNEFTGSFPSSLWEIDMVPDSRGGLHLQENKLVGEVPEKFCADVNSEVRILVDDSRWFHNEPKVNCACCTNVNCQMWNAAETASKCPPSNILNIDFYYLYTINDLVTGDTVLERVGADLYEREICLSPTGCYEIGVFTEIKSTPDSFFFNHLSYSSSMQSLKEQEVCDTVEICGNFFSASHARRNDLNHLTKLVIPDLAVLSNPALPKYKALCWMMTQDSLFDDVDYCDGTLLQRYILALFYISQPSTFSFEVFSSDPTCKWPGVSCDPEQKFVENLNFSNANLTGTLITEIGFLARLKTIDLSKNLLSGTIDPSMFTDVPHLEVFNIGDNKFEGQLPNELLMLPQLKEVNISNNVIIGTLPNDVIYSESLESFDLGNNLLHGTIANALVKCQNLKLLDLSRNNFNGNIPPAIGNLENIQIIKLHENSLCGSIPSEIFNSLLIDTLMLQSNELTGSIPTEIGNFKILRIASLSHNRLKGAIPSELGTLQRIEILHLHRNFLTGLAPEIELVAKSQNSFITDCGSPSHLPILVECTSCTMCCNSDEKCHLYRVFEMPVWMIPALFAISIPFIFTILDRFILKTKLKNCCSCFFVDDRDSLSIYKSDSVYCFILSENEKGWLIYSFTMAIQIWLLAIYVQASKIASEDTDWQYTITCPGNSLDCEDKNSVGNAGWMLFVVVTILYLGSDFILSLLQIRKAVTLLDVQLFVSGFLLFWVTASTMCTSFYYNVALAENNTDLIMTAVILFFIKDLDERLMNILLTLAPTWTATLLVDVESNMSKKRSSTDPNYTAMNAHSSKTPYRDEKGSVSKENSIETVEITNDIGLSNHIFESALEASAQISSNSLSITSIDTSPEINVKTTDASPEITENIPVVLTKPAYFEVSFNSIYSSSEFSESEIIASARAFPNVPVPIQNNEVTRNEPVPLTKISANPPNNQTTASSTNTPSISRVLKRSSFSKVNLFELNQSERGDSTDPTPSKKLSSENFSRALRRASLTCVNPSDVVKNGLSPTTFTKAFSNAPSPTQNTESFEIIESEPVPLTKTSSTPSTDNSILSVKLPSSDFPRVLKRASFSKVNLTEMSTNQSATSSSNTSTISKKLSSAEFPKALKRASFSRVNLSDMAKSDKLPSADFLSKPLKRPTFNKPNLGFNNKSS